jgi:hypothetical protein
MCDLHKKHIEFLKEEIAKVDWERLYNQVKDDQIYNKSYLSHLCIISSFIFDDLRDGEKCARIGGFIKCLTDTDIEPRYMEILQVIAMLSKMHLGVKDKNMYM